MLKEIKCITGEEHSDMIFTLDSVDADCKEKKHGNTVSGNNEEDTKDNMVCA